MAQVVNDDLRHRQIVFDNENACEASTRAVSSLTSQMDPESSPPRCAISAAADCSGVIGRPR